MGNARIVDPIPIGDQELLASNILERLPASTSAVSYSQWDATHTYAAADAVCWAFVDPLKRGLSPVQFAVFTAISGSNLNREPAKAFAVPRWYQESAAPVWSSGTTYASGDQVIHVSSGLGHLWQSLVSSNIGNDPATGPGGNWSLLSADSPVWSGGTTYAAGGHVTRISGSNGYIFVSVTPSNIGNDPLAADTLPGAAYWTQGRTEALWDATLTYGSGAIVGHIAAGSGAFYESLVSGNLNHNPASAPTYWRQVTVDLYDTWGSGTTYGLGARTSVFTGTRGTVYRSLQAGNLNNVPASSPTWWAWEGESFKTWSSAPTYATGDNVIVLSNHHQYEALQASTNKNPLTEPTYWLDLGVDNRWRMFDGANTSQSIFGNVIDVTFSADRLIDTVAVMNVSAASVEIIATAGGIVVYDQTFTLNSGLTLPSWYSWFFDPVSRKTDALAAGIPASSNMQIQIIALDAGNAVAIGSVVAGYGIPLGATLYGATVGWRDFSRVEADEFGERQIVERGYSKTGTFKMFVNPGDLDGVMTTLATRRAKASLLIATDEYATTWIYGFAKAPTGSIDFPSATYLNLEFEGLI